MRRLKCLLSLGLALLLTGCLFSETDVFDAAQADDVPGVAGHWKTDAMPGAISFKTHQFFARVDPEGGFRVGETTDQLDEHWIAHELGEGYFVAEVRRPESEPNMLILGKVLPEYLALYAFNEEQVTAAAAKAGLHLDAKSGLPMIVAGASTNAVLATFKELSAQAGFDQAVIYTRMGSFVEPRGEGNSHVAMRRLLDAGELEAAIEMGRYLSERGDAAAQKQLLALARQGKLGRAEGIRHGRRAIRSGALEAEAALGKLYALGLSQGMDPNGEEADHALFWLFMARTAETRSEDVDSELRALISAICSRDTAADKAANCLQPLPSYWTLRAQSRRMLVSAESSLLAVRAEKEAVEARQREIKQQLEALQLEQDSLVEEKRTLEGQRDALDIEQCGAPGCAARK